MSKHYSRDRSPLSPARYERTAGHSRSAKSPIGISKAYSSDSYKELKSYSGKSYDKYVDKKYSKHDNGYKDVHDRKYDDGPWRPKESYKAIDKKLDDYKYSYLKPLRDDRSKYDKQDYKRPLSRERSPKNDYKRPFNRARTPKYDKDYYKKSDKESYAKKGDKYKDLSSAGFFKSNSRSNDVYYFKDAEKKGKFSSPDSYTRSSSKDLFAKPLDRVRHTDRSSYKVVSLYPDKHYNDLLPSKSYSNLDFKDKYYDDSLSFGSKYGSKEVKKNYSDYGSGKGSLSIRRNNSSGGFDPFVFPDEYPGRSNSSYERYVIGDSVVYGSPGHQPDDIYSPGNRSSRFNPLPPLLPTRSTNDSRYSLTPPRYRRNNDSFEKLSPVRNKRPLSPFRSKRTVSSNRLPLGSRRSREDFDRDRHRSASLKSSPAVPRLTRDRYDDSVGYSRTKGRDSHSIISPRPLLSIRLPAGSIPRASRMHIDQTVSIRDQAGVPRGRRGGFGRRLDGRIGRADFTQSRDRPQRSSDLRLWIESRKNVNRKVAKIFPTKSEHSRRENLSAIANRVRLLEARKRALQSEGNNRRVGVKRTNDVARHNSSRTTRPPRRSSKVRETRKASKSPARKSRPKKSLIERAERRRTLVAKATTTKRTTSSGAKKLLKSTTKKVTSKSRRSPQTRTKRRSPLKKKYSDKR